jgi:hypothetical protein
MMVSVIGHFDRDTVNKSRKLLDRISHDLGEVDADPTSVVVHAAGNRALVLMRRPGEDRDDVSRWEWRPSVPEWADLDAEEGDQ